MVYLGTFIGKKFGIVSTKHCRENSTKTLISVWGQLSYAGRHYTPGASLPFQTRKIPLPVRITRTGRFRGTVSNFVYNNYIQLDILSVFCSTTCIHCKGGVSLTMSPTWSDPGQVSADYHGGQHNSTETKSSCNRHKLLVGRQWRASAKHGGTAHAHAPALSADAKAAHVQCRTCHSTTTRSSRSVISLLRASVLALPTLRTAKTKGLSTLWQNESRSDPDPIRIGCGSVASTLQ